MYKYIYTLSSKGRYLGYSSKCRCECSEAPAPQLLPQVPVPPPRLHTKSSKFEADEQYLIFPDSGVTLQV